MASSNSFRNFECPICFEIPLKKIFQCKNGHVICEQCWLRMLQSHDGDFGSMVCHHCRKSMNHSPIRALSLEMIIQDSVFTCKNKDCDTKLSSVRCE